MLYLKHNTVQPIQPTMFPDRTSQVWNLKFTPGTPAEIWWKFDHESELMHLAQLVALVRAEGIKLTRIVIPFLPYARQDKTVSNTSTFAFNTFAQMLGFVAGNTPVKALDIHGYPYFIENIQPTEFILKALIQSKADVIIFPDAGAKRRYSHVLDMIPHIVLEKTRDQATGAITGLQFENGKLPMYLGTKGLMVDDICDGGKTFTTAAKLLNDTGLKDISLYTTHGIYSKGVDVLLADGINHLFTTNSYTNLKSNDKLTIFGVEHL